MYKFLTISPLCGYAKKLLLVLCFLAIFCVTTQAVEIHRWKFDETSGSTVYDSIGGVHGTMYGGAYLSSGAGQFDGSNDYVQLNQTIRLHDEANWTISVWYKGLANYGTGTGGATLVGTLGGDWWASLNLVGGKAKYLHATNNGYEPGWDNLIGTSNVANNQWHNIIIRNYSNRTADVIVDGVVEVSGSSLLAGTPSQDIMSFRLDYFMMGDPGAYTSGALKDVRVFNHTLSNAEISTITSVSVPEPATWISMLLVLVYFLRKKQ